MGEQEVFGRRMRSRRRQLNLTQAELAAKLGVRTASVSRYEQGEYRSITFEQLRHFAAALQTSTDFLLGLSNEAGPIPDLRRPEEARSLDGLTLPLTTTTLERTAVNEQYSIC